MLTAYALVSGAVLAGLLMQMRSDALASGENVLNAFAQLTEEQTTRTFQNVDQTLVSLASESVTVADSVALTLELRVLRATRPFLRALSVTDEQGRVIAGTEAGVGGMDLSYRPYFIRHRDDPTAEFVVGAPLKGRLTGAWVLPATRSMRLPNGEFAGVIIAAVDPRFFDRVWTVERSMPEQATALWSDRGMMLMRSPFVESTMGGTTFGPSILAHTRDGAMSGSYEAVSTIDGRSRLVAFRRIADYPEFILSVTQPTERVLAAWHHTVAIGVSGWAVAMAMLIALAVWLIGEWNARRATQDRYRVLFNANPHPMVVMDPPTRRFLDVNDAALKEYGWSLREALAMTAYDVYPPEDLAILAERKIAVASEVVQVIRGLRHLKKDGTAFEVEMHTCAIQLDGKAAILTMVENVTTRHAIEGQLRQSQKMEAVGQLTGGIAHDFNNILTVILANADALQEEERLDASVTGRLDQIAKAVQRAGGLTRQLLAFSRKQKLNPQHTDINLLVAGIGKLLRRSLGAQIDIASVLADGLWPVNVDRTQLETALVNLCVNARDAMPTGGKLLIETRNATLGESDVARTPGLSAGEFVALVVTDTGSGIPADMRDKVFEPFFTTKEVGKGTGLGLSMVYGFIRQSNGHIRIDSEVGRGTTFELFLPRFQGAAEETIVEARRIVLPARAERLLVVEDDDQVRDNVVRQLQSLGYVVAQASDGTLGIAAFEAAVQPFDLMLTDVVMPGPFNGKQLADEVTRRWPATRILFMSGYTENIFVRDGRVDSGIRLLAKPFRKKDLAQMVRETLDGTTPAQ
ncbi:MAG: ATP-binding protein [Alphaproteobacteria bacterium]|nr:ATP-binding protein [Alphaproteobacteria bacterium]